MHIYIASRYCNRHEKNLKELVKTLKSAGHKIVSRWLDNPEDEKPHPHCAYLTDSAVVDKEDIFDADVLLVWHYNVAGATGGMFWEMGYATGLHRAIILMNPDSEQITMVFGLLPEVIHTSTVKETLYELQRLEDDNYEGF